MKLNKNSFLYKLIFGLIWPKKRLVKLLAWNFRYKIKDGFSKGMIYPYFSVEDNPGAKFIGTYENEIFPELIKLDISHPKVIFNIGSAEGYYSIGSALRWKNSKVYSWELDELQRKNLLMNAIANKVQDRVYIKGICKEKELYKEINLKNPDIIIMDVEGEEIDLCSERCIKSSKSSSWIVECHRKGTAEFLVDRFSKTHNILLVPCKIKNKDYIKIMLPWFITNYDKNRLVNEGRIISSHWLVAKPKINNAINET